MKGMRDEQCFANRQGRHGQRGVTLLEVITVMGIVAILMALAVPSYRYVTNANRIAGEANGLLGDLQFARSEAIKEGQPVSVCVSSDSVTCLPANNNWQNGWMVFSDVNGDGVFDAGSDTLLRSQATFAGSDTFIAAPNSLASVTFNREGFAAVPPNAVITLQTVPEVTSYTRCLTVGLVGLVAVQPWDGGVCQ